MFFFPLVYLGRSKTNENMKENHSAKRCENCIVRQFNDMRALNSEELREVSKSKITKSIKKGDVKIGY